MSGIFKKLFGNKVEKSEFDSDESDEFDELAMAVKLKCDIAAMSARNLDASVPEERQYELDRYRRLRDEAISMAMDIHDEFCQGFAIHQIAKLCKEANDLATVEPLFDSVEDEFLREQILEDCPELGREPP